ncbi:NAD-dependent epimerase/dehydratase family protein [Kineococcus rubinsiae]|uniref:NAD-dependent epimerase/dehydratase family protein n=1 Tax=Kineococcus rubinsiae TaxID=2609562 RepID=UPI00143014C3|nr:NAD-dependent epimerase/dehydratase family protein [Kineococcus rubinsiae]NIZ89639.1 NAD-dependent epimerase/dehydratase family protein [Kineococcus rubinsiae]
MRVVVVGATGHVGSYLVPRLVAAGHQVVAVSRGTREPYHPHPAWAQVERVVADREAEDAAGTFGARIAGLGADAVVDLVCFTADSARQLVEALRGRTGFLLHCGTIWVHGVAAASPLTEEDPREPFGPYGTQKAEIEALLLAEARSGGLACTVLHPGHISGPGWPVITPVGNLDPDVWHRLATGRELLVPGTGVETMHHVHADDVAQGFQRALEHRSAALGESFHVVSDRALTVTGFARGVAAWFGRDAVLRTVPWEEFRAAAGEHADASWEHLSRSHSASTAKARRLLGYVPRYTTLQAAAQAVRGLAERGEVDLAGAEVPLL